MKYEIIIRWSDRDNSSGCMADGETYQSALQNVEVIMREWIETAKELGRVVPG